MICPNCGANIDDRSYFCNRCGAAQNREQTPESGERDRYGPREYRSDQPPPPANGLDLSGLGGKKYLLLSLACFGWALVKGAPAVFRLLRVLPELAGMVGRGFFQWPRLGPAGLVSAFFFAGLHFAAPLIVGLILLRKHKETERQ